VRRFLRGDAVLVVGTSLMARLTVLLVLIAAAASLPRPDFQFVAYMLAVTSAAQILMDPNLPQLLVVRWPALAGDRARAFFRSAVVLQLLAGIGVVAITTGIAVAVDATGMQLLTAASLALLAAAEAMLRCTRSVWQAEQRFRPTPRRTSSSPPAGR
jgi:hypothetical protein